MVSFRGSSRTPAPCDTSRPSWVRSPATRAHGPGRTFLVQPVQIIIIDFELEIGRDPGRLDGGEINAFDGSFGMGIGDVPGTC